MERQLLLFNSLISIAQIHNKIRLFKDGEVNKHNFAGVLKGLCNFHPTKMWTSQTGEDKNFDKIALNFENLLSNETSIQFFSHFSTIKNHFFLVGDMWTAGQL